MDYLKFIIVMALFIDSRGKILISVPHYAIGRELGEDTPKSLVQETPLNYRPIVGILAEDLPYKLKAFTNKTSLIASSYVKFIESAGARVVPIKIDETSAYYEKISTYVNGILFPGGGLPIDSSSGYGKAGKTILDLIMKSSEDGRPIPLWTTCLGFEMLLYLLSPNDPRSSCDASNMKMSLEFKTNSSRLFADASDQLISNLSNKNITSNFHHFCIFPEDFYNNSLENELTVISTSRDGSDKEFISTVEHNKYPIYGTQWHPEKAAFEWTAMKHHSNIPHDLEAIEASQYLANFFVEEARANRNRFPSIEDELESSIHNYEEVYIAPLKTLPYDQIYLL